MRPRYEMRSFAVTGAQEKQVACVLRSRLVSHTSLAEEGARSSVDPRFSVVELEFGRLCVDKKFSGERGEKGVQGRWHQYDAFMWGVGWRRRSFR